MIHVIVVDKNERTIVSGYSDYTQFDLVADDKYLYLKNGDELKLTFDQYAMVNRFCKCCGRGVHE